MTTPGADHLDLVAAEFVVRATAAFTGTVYADRVYDGAVDDAEVVPYVVVWSDLGRLLPEKLTARSTRHEMNWWVHCYGTSMEQARGASARLIGQLVDLRMGDVGGRRCGPLRLLTSQPPQREDGLLPNLQVYDAVTTWRCSSTPI